MTPKNFRVQPDMYAGKWKRFANYILDRIFFILFIYLFFAVLGFIVYTFFTDTLWFDQLLYDMDNMSKIMDRVISLIIVVILYAITEIVLKGKTLGKYITKTKVVMEDGSAPKPADIIIRSLCRLIPLEAFSFLGEEGRGWHDSMSETYVVDEEKFNRKIETEQGLEQLGKTTNF